MHMQLGKLNFQQKIFYTVPQFFYRQFISEVFIRLKKPGDVYENPDSKSEDRNNKC